MLALKERLKPWLDAGLEAAAQSREARCPAAREGFAQSLECRAGAGFLRRAEPERFYLAELGRAADAKAAYPAATCAQ